MNKKYRITLLLIERAELEHLITSGQAAARKLLHAQILLKADSSEVGPAWTDLQISEALEISIGTVQRIRQLYVEKGLEAALNHKKPVLTRVPKIAGEVEAQLVALACSPVPAGRVHWSVRLLTQQIVALGYVESVGRETIRLALKKRNLKPG